MRRLLMAVRWAGSVWLAAALAAAAWVPVAAASGPQLTLSEALSIAQACGPAFRDLARRQEAQLLAAQAEANKHLPSLRFSAGARLAPGFSGGALATLDWQVNEDLSLELQLPAGTPPNASAGRATVALLWSRQLWPAADRSLAAQIEAHEDLVASLEQADALYEAVRDVIEAFYAAHISAARAELARRAAEMAAARAEDALARYEQGLIGLRTLQDEQNAWRQAEAALQLALTEADRAEERLARLLGDGLCPNAASGHKALVDDLPWEAFLRGLEESLGGYTPSTTADPHRVADEAWRAVWTERLLAHSAAYARAVLGELAGREALAAAERKGQPSLQLSADAGHAPAAGGVGWSVSLQVTWDLSPNAPLERARAEQEAEAAQDRLQAARAAALDAGRSAWLAVAESLQALERARSALDTAQRTEEVVLRRVAAGLAPAVEAEEARLEVERRLLDVAEAEAGVRTSWLLLAQRLGWAWPDALLVR